jgi:hypothetical protein
MASRPTSLKRWPEAISTWRMSGASAGIAARIFTLTEQGSRDERPPRRLPTIRELRNETRVRRGHCYFARACWAGGLSFDEPDLDWMDVRFLPEQTPSWDAHRAPIAEILAMGESGMLTRFASDYGASQHRNSSF